MCYNGNQDKYNMKINEIKNIEALNEYSNLARGIKAELEEKGYTYLGQGVDQVAYLEPGTGQVLKIFGTRDETKGSGGITLSEDQKMFYIWANFCMKNSNNKFLPKFDGFEKFIFDNHTYLQIRQEFLVDSGAIGYQLAALNRLINGYSNKVLSSEDIYDIIEEECSRYTEDAMVFAAAKQYLGEAELRQFINTVVALMKISRSKKWTWDLHRHNIMKRKDGTPIIVDPWVLD